MGTLNIIGGGRPTGRIGELPLEAYDVDTGVWDILPKLARFRHSAWVYDDVLFVFGGFECSIPTIPVTKQMSIDLSSFIKIKKKEHSLLDAKLVGFEELVGLGFSEKIEFKKSLSLPILDKANQDETVDNFTLSPRVLIAVRSTPETPPAIQRMVKSISLKRLNLEAKKLIPTNAVLFGPDLEESKEPEPVRESLSQKFINQLLRPKNNEYSKLDRRFPFRKDEIIALTDECAEIVKNEPTVIRITIPVKVFGDFHGQYQDMMRFFELWRSPIESIHGGDIESYDYLFLGDYVDRGTNSLEVICLLMALKVKFPKQIHLLRGNHEDFAINSFFGFAEECEKRLDDDLDNGDSVFQTLNRFFELLPLAGIIEDKILCLHGGIGSTLKSIADLEKIERPIEIVHDVKTPLDQLLIDVLWSDPTDSDQELGIQKDLARDPCETGYIVKFGPDRVESFLQDNNLMMIIRAHECVMDGIERFAKGQLITVFSATDYCGSHKNAGAALFIQKDYQIIPKLIYPVNMDKELYWMEQKRSQAPSGWKDNPNDKSFD